MANCPIEDFTVCNQEGGSSRYSESGPRVVLSGGVDALPCDPREAIPLTDVPDLLPRRRGGKRLHPSTVFRWRDRGILAADGTRVRLPCFRCGRRLYTHRTAIEEFIRHLTDPARQPLPVVATTTAIDEHVARRLRGGRKER